MKRRVISMTLVLVFILTVVGVRPLITKDNVARAEEFRNGFSLTPTKFDGTGIDTKTSFILKSAEDITLESIKEGLTINPEITFEIEKLQEGFLIKPNAELSMNSLYTFSYLDTTWTFQTMSLFKILGTLPANETSNVPINTGIEMIFSYEGAQVKDYFQIQPEVSGVFETHGKTIVFVPTKLKEKTVYTVTLKAGLSLSDSDQKLLQDYRFSFETGQEKEEPYVEPKGYFNFNSIISEFGLNEIPNIPISYSVYDTNSKANIKTNVYAYPSIEQFGEAVVNYNKAPFWSYYALENNRIKSDKLNKVLSFEQPISYEYTNQQFLKLPEKLNAGYYLVDCTWEDIHFQTLIQVTNLSYYFVDSSTMNLLWINDLATGNPVTNATVKEMDSPKSFNSNMNGIVELPSNKNENDLSIYYINSGKQSALVLDQVPYHTYWKNNTNSNYWRYLQTDRNLYLPDDTIKLWGFIKNRYEKENIDEVTIEINTMSWRFYESWGGYKNDVPFASNTIKVDKGFYNGEIRLPNLEPGSYQIEVKFKNHIVSSTYIQVEKYVKPEYKIEVISDKKAIFSNDSVVFTTKTAFFEGTPVSNIKANYNIQGLDYIEGELKSDLKGEGKVNYLAPYISGYQGLTYVNMNVYANLPESGQIYADYFIKVFMNDINVKINTTLEDEKGTINIETNKIILDKLNDSIEDNDEDYLGEAVSNHNIKGIVYKNEWKKREIGDYYDYINKIVVTQYEYYTEKTKLQDITINTNADGKGTTQVNLPKQENSYYTAELTTVDLAGNKMTFDQYFGESWVYSPNTSDRYYLKSDKEMFDLGDEIKVDFIHNNQTLPEGNYLYISAQNGIKKYETAKSATYKTTFNEAFFPNADIIGVYFNGKTYVQGERFSPRLDIENNRITFTATTDKATYKPGEICTVDLKATIYSKEDAKTIGAEGVTINISIVDEALLKLSDQYINTLESLFEWVPNGINFEYVSHKNEGYGFGRPIMYGMGGIQEEALTTADMSVAKEMANDGAAQGVVRSEFKDTAYFASVQLDDNGHGTFSFKLPDNVTSWRMTFAGISEKLMAGTNTQELVVSLPYFINTSFNTTFLEGDKPSIGVSTYGNNLKQGEAITYEITCKENDYKTTASGSAFERTNIPLFEMKEGTYTLIVRSTSSTGYTDAIEKQIKVFKTYHQKEKADYYKLTNGLTLSNNNSGMTKITFVDEGKGQFMPKLYDLAYNSGKRIDQKYIGYVSRNILEEYFDVSSLLNDEVQLTDYQMDDGGFGILPYAGSDLETTVKILPLVKDSINKKSINTYLDYMYNNSDNNKAIALYGLALMDEPVILELEKISKISNLSTKEQIYLSMAYAVLGDRYKAETIYKDFISPLLKKYEDVARVEVGKTEDDYLEYSALTMILASYLDLDDKELLFNYVSGQYSKEILVQSELLTYIKIEILKVAEEKLAIDYTYDGQSYSVELENGWPQTVTIPSVKMKDFIVNNVDGKGGLVAIYDEAFSKKIDNDTNLSASRTYINYYTEAETKTFKQSDIVKVKIDWNIDKMAIDNGYILTDYVPSGLKPIENVWDLGLKTDDHYWYRDIEGQKITFYVYESNVESKPLYYYARVVAPGSYQAEGLIIQGSTVKSSMWLGKQDSITILE